MTPATMRHALRHTARAALQGRCDEAEMRYSAAVRAFTLSAENWSAKDRTRLWRLRERAKAAFMFCLVGPGAPRRGLAGGLMR